MSLIKIPFLLALTTCVHLAINPPNKATKTEHYTPKNSSWRTAEFALGIVFKSMFPIINVSSKKISTPVDIELLLTGTVDR